MTTYLITGASGQLGKLVIDHLKTLVPLRDIIALVRSDEAKAHYAEKGISARIGDYDDVDSLKSAFVGVDRLLLISSSEVGKRAAQHNNVVQAAIAANVSFVAYTSLLNAESGGMALAQEHVATEKDLRESGIPHTVLRNGWYSENIAGTAMQAVAIGQHFGAANDGRFASATRQDLAEAAAIVLAQPGHEAQTYELGGDEHFSLSEYAAILSDLAGTSVAYTNLDQESYSQALVQAGLPEQFAAVLADSDAKAANGALFTDSGDLAKIIGRPATPISETLRAALAG